MARRELAPDTLRAEGRHPDVDQSWMPGRQSLRVQAQGLQLARRTVKHHNIGLLDQSLEAGFGEFCGQNPLISVPNLIARMGLQAVPPGGLDLDNLCPEVTQQHGRHRSGHTLGKVENAQALIC